LAEEKIFHTSGRLEWGVERWGEGLVRNNPTGQKQQEGGARGTELFMEKSVPGKEKATFRQNEET